MPHWCLRQFFIWFLLCPADSKCSVDNCNGLEAAGVLVVGACGVVGVSKGKPVRSGRQLLSLKMNTTPALTILLTHLVFHVRSL